VLGFVVVVRASDYDDEIAVETEPMMRGTDNIDLHSPAFAAFNR